MPNPNPCPCSCPCLFPWGQKHFFNETRMSDIGYCYKPWSKSNMIPSSSMGGSDMRLSPISFITDIRLRAHLWGNWLFLFNRELFSVSIQHTKLPLCWYKVIDVLGSSWSWWPWSPSRPAITSPSYAAATLSVPPGRFLTPWRTGKVSQKTLPLLLRWCITLHPFPTFYGEKNPHLSIGLFLLPTLPSSLNFHANYAF